MNRMRRLSRRLWACVLTLAFLLGFAIPQTGAAQLDEEERILSLFEARKQQIAEIMEAATVLVLVFDKDGDAQGMGSGFIVGDGLVMTNAHVVNKGVSFKVMNSTLKASTATVVRKQGSGQGAGEADFALLRFKSDVKLPVLSFNTQIKRMDRVSAWGFPHMMTQFDQALEDALKGDARKVPPVVYTEGTVNTLVRKGRASNIFHSAAIAGGNSGGPLINSRGEVVGINTWGYTEKDEGAAIFAALPAEGMIIFLQQCGVTPQMAKRTTLGIATAPTPSASPASPNPTPIAEAPQTAMQTAIQTAMQGVSTPATTPPPIMSLETKSDTDGEQTSPKDTDTLLREANAGSVEAQYQLGYNYYYGEGVDENEQEAARWLGKAVAQGQNDARAILGILYIFSATQKNVPQGMSLLQQAADEDVDYAPLLALLFYEGEGHGVERDVKKSFHYATLGTEAGLADAQALLGMLYFYGEMGKEEPRRAFTLAQQAVNGESMLGQSLMAWLYFTGKEVKEDSRKAFTLALDAAEAEESSAMGLLALLYYTGDGVEEDDEKAREWAQRASDAGNEFGHLVLGGLFSQDALKSGGKKNTANTSLPTAWAYLTLATDKGIASARKQREKIEPLMSKNQKAEGKRQRDAWRTERGLAP